MNENKQDLSIAFRDSINSKLVTIASDAAELGLDSILDDGLLKDIPFVSTAISLYKIGNSISERHYLRKLSIFIDEIINSTADEEIKTKYKDKLMCDCKRRNKELEYILILIDRYVDNKKPKLLAKLYLAFLDAEISWTTFAEMSEIIDRLFVSDLNSLCEFYYHGGVMIEENRVSVACVLRLLSVGFVEQQTNFIWHEASSADTQKSKSDFDYYITDFGKQFIDIFKDDILKNECLI